MWFDITKPHRNAQKDNDSCSSPVMPQTTTCEFNVVPIGHNRRLYHCSIIHRFVILIPSTVSDISYPMFIEPLITRVPSAFFVYKNCVENKIAVGIHLFGTYICAMTFMYYNVPPLHLRPFSIRTA